MATIAILALEYEITPDIPIKDISFKAEAPSTLRPEQPLHVTIERRTDVAGQNMTGQSRVTHLAISGE
jgi:hypothetical protein